jgi:predicted  nucleic acid-binding Zn-ribbon protein
MNDLIANVYFKKLQQEYADINTKRLFAESNVEVLQNIINEKDTEIENLRLYISKLESDLKKKKEKVNN